MTPFVFQQGCTELLSFGYLNELGLKKHSAIRFDSIRHTTTNSLRLYYVIDGRFEWIIGDTKYLIYPGDIGVIKPGSSFGCTTDCFHAGTVTWINIATAHHEDDDTMLFGSWSSLSGQDMAQISRNLRDANSAVIANIPEAGSLLQKLRKEISGNEIGHITRVNQLVDELLILIGRRASKSDEGRSAFPQSFMRLEQSLRNDLNHHWSVAEMAAMVGLRHTAFTEKVKSFTGFSPLNYLINIRIARAVALLKQRDHNVTDIALDTGFYSSQHFATTFKKMTGYSPSEFRRKNAV
ncbi:MAG: AraC family transcriptional regulator [Flavitalea sp.]